MFRLDMSPTGYGRVVVASVAATLGCIALSFTVNSLGLTSAAPNNWPMRILASVGIPLVIAFPIMWFLMSKLRELAIANTRMSILASTDSLTAVLNRGAFTMLVEAYLSDARTQASEMQGALLIIDADHFKDINDSFGHARGDEALKVIAGAIQGVLRSADIVGRIGGEEFGVFLPGASPRLAESIAESIRSSVNVAEFVPASEAALELSVSVGGAMFASRVGFTELFRAADERLYHAKRQGRNRVSLITVGPVAAAA